VDFREKIKMERLGEEILEGLKRTMKEMSVEVLLNLLPHSTRHATGHKCMTYTSGFTV
jgi:hypothetical protein